MGQLIKALAQGHLWLDELLRGEARAALDRKVGRGPACLALPGVHSLVFPFYEDSDSVHGQQRCSWTPWLGMVRPQKRRGAHHAQLRA
jgi:hypothetical protein